MRLQVVSSNSTYYWSVTNAAPAKPYLQISNQYLPLTTATRAGIKLKVQSGNTTYRAAVYESGYYNTTSAAVGNLSSTTALTRASTSGTTYLTRASTSGTNYGTRASTSATLTRASTSATLTRASTSNTIYLTRASTSGTNYGTKASTVSTPITSSTWNSSQTSAGRSYAWITHARIYSHVGTLGTAVFVESSTCNGFNSAFTVSKYDFVNNGMTFKRFDTRNYTAVRHYSQYYSRPWRHHLWIYKPNNATYSTSWTVSDPYGASSWPGTHMQLSYSGFGKTSPLQWISTQNSYYNWYTTTTFNYNGSIATSWRNYTSSLAYTDTDTAVTNMYNGTSYVGPMTITARSWYDYDIVAVRFLDLSTVATFSTSTNVVTTGTTYLTRASTSGTSYATRTSASGYATRTSASGYATRSSISGYATRASTSGVTYLTRASTSGTNYGTKVSTSGYSGKLSSSKWG